MGLAKRIAEHIEPSVEDTILLLPNAMWADYQRHLEMRGDKSAPRISFLEGTIEIASPSHTHEQIKSQIGCLVEVWCLENNIDVFGNKPEASRPDLAIEVVWTSGGLNKLDVYRKLGVEEVWFWRRGVITIHVLRDDNYEEVSASLNLVGIDVGQLVSFLDRPSTSQAMRDYRAHLQAG